MVIHLDTSVLIDIFSDGAARTGIAMEQALDDGDRINVSMLVLYEWLRGRRREAELRAQEAFLPVSQVVPFGLAEAFRAALIFRAVKRPRRRGVDLAIAACAIENRAALWTLNTADFADVPGLLLYRPDEEAPHKGVPYA